MKKLRFLLFVSILCLIGCTNSQEEYDTMMSELECPVILIGKTDKAVAWPCIVVKDCKGRVRTFQKVEEWNMTSQGFPTAISDSRNIGDTLKDCGCSGSNKIVQEAKKTINEYNKNQLK